MKLEILAPVVFICILFIIALVGFIKSEREKSRIDKKARDGYNRFGEIHLLKEKLNKIHEETFGKLSRFGYEYFMKIDGIYKVVKTSKELYAEGIDEDMYRKNYIHACQTNEIDGYVAHANN